MSVERSGNQLWLKGFQQALQPLVAQIRLGGEDGVILPGADVEVAAVNPRITRPVAWDDAIGAYVYAYTDDQQMERIVTIENSSSFAPQTQLAGAIPSDAGDGAGCGFRGCGSRSVGGGPPVPDGWEREHGAGDAEGILQDFHPDGGLMEEVTVPIENPAYTFMAPAGEGDNPCRGAGGADLEFW